MTVGEMPIVAYMALIFGPSGVGKTHLASLCDDPVFMLTEPQAVHTIRTANPKAKIKMCTTADNVRDFMRDALNGTLPGKTIVVDGLTEIQQLLKDEIVARNHRRAKLAKESGGKVVDPDLFTLDNWGELADKMRKFLRTLRAATLYRIVATCISSHTDDSVHLKLQGMIKEEAGSYFTIVGYLFKRLVRESDADADADKNAEDKLTEGTVKRLVMFDGPSKYFGKPAHPLPRVSDKTPAEWFDLMDSIGKLEPDTDTDNDTDNDNDTDAAAAAAANLSDEDAQALKKDAARLRKNEAAKKRREAKKKARADADK